jgi:transposase
MIDPDLKYCPECNGEYMAEIEECTPCRVTQGAIT